MNIGNIFIYRGETSKTQNLILLAFMLQKKYCLLIIRKKSPPLPRMCRNIPHYPLFSSGKAISLTVALKKITSPVIFFMFTTI